MSVRVRVPTPLRTLTGGQADVTAEGESVSAIISHLEATYPVWPRAFWTRAARCAAS